MTGIPLITVVANYFVSKKDKKELKFSTLNTIKNAVESHFLINEKKFVYVDTSWDEISYVVETYSNYFGYNDNYTAIKFNEQLLDEFYEDVYFIFNHSFNSDAESCEQHKIIVYLEDFIKNHLVE